MFACKEEFMGLGSCGDVDVLGGPSHPDQVVCQDFKQYECDTYVCGQNGEACGTSTTETLNQAGVAYNHTDLIDVTTGAVLNDEDPFWAGKSCETRSEFPDSCGVQDCDV